MIPNQTLMLPCRGPFITAKPRLRQNNFRYSYLNRKRFSGFSHASTTPRIPWSLYGPKCGKWWFGWPTPPSFRIKNYFAHYLLGNGGESKVQSKDTPKTDQGQSKDNPKTIQRQSKDNPKTIQRKLTLKPNHNKENLPEVIPGKAKPYAHPFLKFT